MTAIGGKAMAQMPVLDGKAKRKDGSSYTKPPMAVRKKINRRRAKEAKASRKAQRV